MRSAEATWRMVLVGLAALLWPEAAALRAQPAPATATQAAPAVEQAVAPPAAAQIAAAAPTCALWLGPGATESLAAWRDLLEIKLGEAGWQMVTREHLGRVADEAALSLLLEAEQSHRRAEAGRLLQADLLVLLRPAAAVQAAADEPLQAALARHAH